MHILIPESGCRGDRMSEEKVKRKPLISGMFYYIRTSTGELKQESRKWKIAFGVTTASALLLIVGLTSLSTRSNSGWGTAVVFGTIIIGIVLWIFDIISKNRWQTETVFFEIPMFIVILLVIGLGGAAIPLGYVVFVSADITYWLYVLGGGIILLFGFHLNERMGTRLKEETRAFRITFQAFQFIALIVVYLAYIVVFSAPPGVIHYIDFLFLAFTIFVGITLWFSRSMLRWDMKSISVKLKKRYIWFIVFSIIAAGILYPISLNTLPSRAYDFWAVLMGGGVAIALIFLLFYEGYPQIRDRGAPGLVAISGFLIVFVILYMTIIAYWIVPYDPFYINSRHILEPPSPAYPLGTTQLGQDLLSRVLAGGATMFQVALLSVAVCFTVGVPIGLWATYKGGMIDRSIGLVMDSIFAFPGLVLAIAITAMLGPGVVNMALSIAVVYIPSYFRVVRSQVLTIRELPYVEAAIVMGARDKDILFRYILPNALPSAVVVMSINFADAILTAAGLTFIGLGPPVEIADWGWDLTFGFDNMIIGKWWEATFPGIMIVVLALGFTIAGEGLNEILTPKLQE